MTVEQQTSSLELAVIGNSRVGALIDARASIVWMCVPRFDGDPAFCALLDDNRAEGRFDIEQQKFVAIAGLPQPFRTAGRDHRRQHTRIVRKLPADLKQRRDHYVRKTPQPEGDDAI